MTTIIRRTAAPGDTRLPRRPFPEPGVMPISRLSALSWDGVDGSSPVDLEDAGTCPDRFTNAGNVWPGYQVRPDGVPAYRFNIIKDGALAASPTVHHATVGAAVKSFLAVVDFSRLPSSAATGSGAYAWILRPATTGDFGLAVRSTANPTGPGSLIGATGPGSPILVGPRMPVDGRLHLVALVYDGAHVRLYLDGDMVESDAVAPVASDVRFLAGYNSSGADYSIVEASAYTEALTHEQVLEKFNDWGATYGC